MKKISIISLFILILITACEPQINILTPSFVFTETLIPTLTPTETEIPKPSNTPLPTQIPCPTEPVKIENMTVYFYGEVADQDCDLVLSFVMRTNNWIIDKGYDSPVSNIYVFDTIDGVSKFETTISNLSYEDAVAKWTVGGASVYPGNALYTTEGWWQENPRNEPVKAVIHESIHLLQHSLVGGNFHKYNDIPKWWVEGQADYYGRALEKEWGVEPPYILPNLLKCSYDLDQLKTLAGDPFGCLYMQGEQAFILLQHLYGSQDFKLWELMNNGLTFKNAFKQVYGISLNEFSVLYDEFRINKYEIFPVIPTSTP